MDQERCNVRITLSPFLQAEEDIRYVLLIDCNSLDIVLLRKPSWKRRE